MFVVGLILFVIHICAFIAGGANSVLMPVVGPRMAKATPAGREELLRLVEAVSKVGKYAMVTLLVTGILVLWLKWDFNIPNAWFWVKMAGIVGMLVCISINEMNFKKAKAGDAKAAAQSKLFGQLTGAFFLLVIVAAVFAFN